MINIEQGRRWKHYQLTTTNNQFTLDESLMEKVFEACGYKFTIVRPKDKEPHFISQDVSEGLGYARNDYLTEQLKKSDLPLLKLTNDNGLTSLKLVSSISKNTRSLMLIPASSLQEFLTVYARKPDAKEVGKKLYEYLSQVKTLVEVFEEPKNPLLDLLNSAAERLGLSKEFLSWYFERVVKSRYLRSWNRRERKYNWLMNQSLGFYFSFHLR